MRQLSPSHQLRMAPKNRVNCLCGCKRSVTTLTEKSHLILKQFKRVPVPEIIRKRRCVIAFLGCMNRCILNCMNSVAIQNSHDEATHHNHPPNTALGLEAGPSVFQGLPESPTTAIPLGCDHNTLWRDVLAARRPVVPDAVSTTSSLSSHASFVSQPDSDADAEPVEAGVSYNPATYGLKLETLLRERSAVERVINGKLYS